MFDLTNPDAGGGAAPEPSTAPTSEAPSTEGQQPSSPETTDSGATPPADPSLITKPEGQDPDPNAPPAEPEPTEEETEAALKATLADPNAPKWYRDKLEQALGYSAKLKADKLAAEEKATTLATQYEGKEVLAQPDIERMKAAENEVMELSSLAATPEQLDAKLKTLNPRAYPALRNHLVWSALEKPDGSPDFDNLQAVIDKFAGEPGKVRAQDALMAIEALKSGLIEPADLMEGNSPEDFAANQRRVESQRQIDNQAARLKADRDFTETQIRKGELDRVTGEIAVGLDGMISPLLDRFKLTPLEGEPKAAGDYKGRVNSEIRDIIGKATTDIPAFAEIGKAIKILGEATGADAQTASAEIQAFKGSPQYQQLLGRGMSELSARIEQTVTQNAYFYKLMMMGLEVENSKPNGARSVLGAPNQAGGLPKLTEEDLAKLSGREREDAAALRLTQFLRDKDGPSRLG
jgi:hypothetical protein